MPYALMHSDSDGDQIIGLRRHTSKTVIAEAFWSRDVKIDKVLIVSPFVRPPDQQGDEIRIRSTFKKKKVG